MEAMRGSEVTPRGPVAAPGLRSRQPWSFQLDLKRMVSPLQEIRAGEPELVQGAALGFLLSAWKS